MSILLSFAGIGFVLATWLAADRGRVPLLFGALAVASFIGMAVTTPKATFVDEDCQRYGFFAEEC
ncbi:hypothetical protein [Mesorhizobium sp. IMUNJ 23232]|uniref:hypothetical protein n=1 Tax=Mesorhizobium sp. IMUNJ 23232 TaxID=3376064 RepID=UPI003787DD2B